MLRRAGFLNETHAAVNLNTQRREVLCGLRQPTLDNGRKKRDPSRSALPIPGVDGVVRTINLGTHIVGRATHRLDL